MRLPKTCGLRQLFIAVCLLLAGCGPTAKDRLVGRWSGRVQFDDAAVQQKLDEEGRNPIKEAIVKKALEAFESGTITLEFKPDGSYTSTSQLGPFSDDDYGTWEVVREQPQEATVRLTSHEGKVQETSVVFADQDVITAPLTGQAYGLGTFRCIRLP